MYELDESIRTKAEQIPGLVDYLLQETNKGPGYENADKTGNYVFYCSTKSIDDLAVDPSTGVAAIIIDQHEWGESGGVGMTAIVLVYDNGQTRRLAYDNWRHRFRASHDRPHLAWSKIERLTVSPEEIVVEIKAPRTGKPAAFRTNRLVSRS